MTTTESDTYSEAHVPEQGFKRNHTPKDHLFFIVFTSCVLLVAGYGFWYYSGTLSGVVEQGYESDTVVLSVNNTQIQATLVDLNTLDTEIQSKLFGDDAVFLIIPQGKNPPRIKVPETPIDVVWLDEFSRVISSEQGKQSKLDETFVYPERAWFGLMVEEGVLKPGDLVPGTIFINRDREKLQ